jgi:mannosyltransferase OCH1-like enzyme
MSEEDFEIPKNIFQTHKSKSFVNSSPSYKKWMNSWLKYSNQNDYKYFFYDDEMCEDFIKNNFEENVYQAYSRLPMAVMKADLWRYCVIYKHGGIYADADTHCVVNPDIFTIPKTFLVCAPELDNIHLCQWCFAAPKSSPILKSIIDLSVKRILETSEIKGEHIVHYLTGPGCFTAGIEKYLDEHNLNVFIDKKRYQEYRNDAMCVFNADKFHTKMILHYFAGNNQWKNERLNLV